MKATVFTEEFVTDMLVDLLQRCGMLQDGVIDSVELNDENEFIISFGEDRVFVVSVDEQL